VEYPYENSTYLGIAGPYQSGSKKIETAPEVLGMPDAVFDSKEIGAQLKAYLQELEEYYATKEE
jgi:hypothetical protein